MTPGTDPHETEKRQLRTAIGRSRRRIDRRLRGTTKAAGQLTSWKTYIRRWPGLGLAAGLGAGWILAAGMRPRFLIGLLGARMVRELTRQATDVFTKELKDLWADSAPRATGRAPEGDGND